MKILTITFLIGFVLLTKILYTDRLYSFSIPYLQRDLRSDTIIHRYGNLSTLDLTDTLFLTPGEMTFVRKSINRMGERIWGKNVIKNGEVIDGDEVLKSTRTIYGWQEFYEKHKHSRGRSVVEG